MKKNIWSIASRFLMGAYIMLFLSACGSGGGSVSTASTAAPYITVTAISYQGGTLPGSEALTQVRIGECSAHAVPLTNALVTVNGVSLPYNPSSQGYDGNVVIGLGDVVSFSVVVNGVTYTASGTQFTEYPTISAPTSGAVWSHLDANTVIWSGGAPTAGAFYVLKMSAASGDGLYYSNVPVSTSSWTIPANSLTNSSRYVGVGLLTDGDGIPISNACAGSGLIMVAVGSEVPITVN